MATNAQRHPAGSIKPPEGVVPDAPGSLVEIWEATTEQTTWLNLFDNLNGGWRAARVGGGSGASKRIQLTVTERRFNQDQIPEECLQLDPFSNGALICVQGEARTANQIDDAAIIALLTGPDEKFIASIDGIKSELLLRRILTISAKHATNERYTYLRDLIDQRYRVGGTQRAMRELYALGEAGRTAESLG